MPGKSSSANVDAGSDKMEVSFKAKKSAAPERQVYSQIPMSYYWFKDTIRSFISQKNFPDALAVVFASFSVSIAFPFFPPIILFPLLLATFIITLYSPLIGLMALLFETLPMFMYQAPLLAWIMVIFMSLALFIAHKHYRSITFVYALIVLPMSFLGAYLEVPAFIIGVLYIGFRRAVASTIVLLLLVPMLSGITGIANSAPILYDTGGAHAMVLSSGYSQYLVPSRAAPTLASFPGAIGSALGGFASFSVASNVSNGFAVAVSAIFYNFEILAVQIVVWLLTVFAITNYVIKSRSGTKGTESSFFCLVILAVYLFLAYVTNSSSDRAVLAGFVATPLIMFALEYNNIEVVKSLDVMKQDFLGKFGDAFQDLTSGTRETLEDVANYDQTKEELRNAILAPIEHREISGAYNVKPARGILLFGPPGTGKTLIMRALANEIRAKFFYVKTSSIISPFQGESAQTLSKIFSTVKKNTPAILFFDEIDGIASNRETQESDNSRQLLSTLLGEMDGFQKLEGIVIVGSTNTPNLLDPAILRPGRFDKIIYMPLPDKAGRAKIFRYYLGKLPISDDMPYPKLADLSARYSGADIKNVCHEVARAVAEEAVKEHKVLQVTGEDVIQVMKNTKPSTSLASIDKYNKFKIDYERRTHPELISEKEGKTRLDDVVGLDNAKKALYEAVEIPILHPNLIKKYDVQNIKGILLFGPPGTGKSMLMGAVANELEGVSLIAVSGSDIAKSGLEHSLTAIKETFDRARENSPSILFIDELDSLLPDRNDSSELAIQVTSEFLQQLDGIRQGGAVILVGATNRPDAIDPAILRPGRVDKFIFVPAPSGAERERLFEEYLNKAPIANGMDFKQLAQKTEGYTGADIANICREAKMRALESNIATSEESTITLKDVLLIINSVKPSAPPGALSRYLKFLSIYGGR